MAKLELSVINMNNPISADGYFDVPMVDKDGNYIYNEQNKIVAKRFAIHGESILENLYDGVDSDSTTLAATANAVKTVNDAVTTLSGTVNTFLIGNGQDGVVDSLSDLINAISENKSSIDNILNDYVLKSSISDNLTSNSTLTIASSKAIKDVYDLANSKYTAAIVTTTSDGLMSSSDKIKLDNLENYTLPNATIDTLGGVKVGYNIDVHDGVISLKDSSTTQKGLVRLSSSTSSTVENLAATPKAVKDVCDLANSKWTAVDGTITTKGIVQLSSSTVGTSETLAGTESAVGIAGTTVTTTPNDATTAYIVGSTSSDAIARDATLTKDKDVYLTKTKGQLHAATFDGNQQFGGTIALAGTVINTSLATCFTKTITTNTTFTFTGASNCTCFSLILTNGGKYNITWPESVRWADGEAPELTLLGIDVLVFMTPNGGTNWYGFKSAIGAA